MDDQKQKKPDIVEMAEKKRHIKILQKIKDPNDVPSKSEVKELAQYEDKSIPTGIVETEEAVAQIFRVSTRTVQYWKKDGMPVTPQGRYKISDIKAWRSAKKEKKDKKKGKDWDEEWRKQRALRELSLNLEREGKLVDRAGIEQALIGLFSVIKARVLALPRGLSPQLQGLDARQIEVILTNRAHEIVSDISTGKIFATDTKDKKKNARKNKKA